MISFRPSQSDSPSLLFSIIFAVFSVDPSCFGSFAFVTRFSLLFHEHYAPSFVWLKATEISLKWWYSSWMNRSRKRQVRGKNPVSFTAVIGVTFLLKFYCILCVNLALRSTWIFILSFKENITVMMIKVNVFKREDHHEMKRKDEETIKITMHQRRCCARSTEVVGSLTDSCSLCVTLCFELLSCLRIQTREQERGEKKTNKIKWQAKSIKFTFFSGMKRAWSENEKERKFLT